MSGGRFRFCGRYRVQSRLEEGPALLEGRWANGAAGLGADDVNAALRGAALWAGTAEVDLRAAEVSRRVGVFAEAADALYYRELFRPAGGSEPMRTDVLDVPKLREHWRRRRPDAARVLGAAALARLEELVGDVGRTGTNEYLCHEAGHALGHDVRSKYAAGYFRLGGKTAWPLVFVEEHRADLHALGFALDLLPRREALAVFAYHVVHRLGLAAFSTRTGGEGSGAVPYLLFGVLLDEGWLRADAGVPAESLAERALLDVMRHCADHAAEALTAPELAAPGLEDVALRASAYYRERALDVARGRLYEAWLSAR